MHSRLFITETIISMSGIKSIRTTPDPCPSSSYILLPITPLPTRHPPCFEDRHPLRAAWQLHERRWWYVLLRENVVQACPHYHHSKGSGWCGQNGFQHGTQQVSKYFTVLFQHNSFDTQLNHKTRGVYEPSIRPLKVPADTPSRLTCSP